MGIIINKGNTAAAREELNAFIMAFPCIEMKPGHYFVFDATDAAMYQDMSENQFVGTFDPLTM